MSDTAHTEGKVAARLKVEAAARVAVVKQKQRLGPGRGDDDR